MIALHENIPLVRWHNKRSIPISESWLAESIELSARTAGYPQWQWSGDVARAILNYLRTEFSGCQITTGQLRQLIQKSLNGIGCEEIAGHVEISAPRVNIHLAELARRSGYEMLFFNLLRGKLDDACSTVVRGVRLEGIRPCVKHLTGLESWRSSCQRLSDEIVDFARAHTSRAQGNGFELMIC
jgi:hypothetical protein